MITDQQYIVAAKFNFERKGEIEIHDNAPVSHGLDSGAYIQAWVWVDNDAFEENDD